MSWIVGAVWVLAGFLAATWTLGLITQPRFRWVSTMAGVICWWAYLAAAAVGLINVLHLIWMMPGILLLAHIFMRAELEATLGTRWVLPKTVVAALIFGGAAWGLS